MVRKRGTVPGDVVLVHYQGKPASFARVEDIRAHQRPGWFHCDMLVLATPPGPLTWILEREQIDGAEFTMGGNPVRLERLAEVGSFHVRKAERGAAASPKETPGAAGAKGARERPRGAATRRQTPAGEKVVQLFPRP